MLQTFDDRGERDQEYTIFTYSASAIDRITSDRLGQGQRPAAASIETCTRLMSRGHSVTIFWTPTHLRVEGNEMTGLYA